uniref:C2H2-type domain-containing protein n=1 Tax=Sphaeramia orbicularis TaxID=375764 RepID=A0A672ZGI0_9TELE
MSFLQILRSLVEQRLTAAAEEIFGLFERTIAEYEEELCRTKEENQRQRQILDCVWNPTVLIHRADVQQLLVVTEEVPPEQQEWNPIVDQEEPEPEPPHIKEEQEELWTSQESKLPTNSSTEQMETETDGDDGGGSEPDMNLVHMESLLEEHMDSYTGQKLVGSSECEKLYDCSVCSKAFCWKSHLEIHMTSHTGEKRFKCSLCLKCFRQKGNLKRHMRVHTGEKPFNCSVCQKRFTCNSTLTGHMLTHTGEKPFSCSECGKRFTWKRVLKQCGKRFSQKTGLERHIMLHTGERPFSCVVYQTSFTRKQHVQNHMKIHTNKDRI